MLERSRGGGGQRRHADMTAVDRLAADKLKKELRSASDKGKKAELKARLVEALGL